MYRQCGFKAGGHVGTAGVASRKRPRMICGTYCPEANPRRQALPSRKPRLRCRVGRRTSHLGAAQEDRGAILLTGEISPWYAPPPAL
jgi:hypothetical protein